MDINYKSWLQIEWFVIATNRTRKQTATWSHNHLPVQMVDWSLFVYLGDTRLFALAAVDLNWLNWRFQATAITSYSRYREIWYDIHAVPKASTFCAVHEGLEMWFCDVEAGRDDYKITIHPPYLGANVMSVPATKLIHLMRFCWFPNRHFYFPRSGILWLQDST